MDKHEVMLVTPIKGPILRRFEVIAIGWPDDPNRHLLGELGGAQRCNHRRITGYAGGYLIVLCGD